MSCRFIYTQTCTTTPPWKVFGAPSNSTSSIAETLPATARHALKSSTTLNAFITASAPTARSATFPQLTSNSKTTNQMTRFYCPFFQSKPKTFKGKAAKKHLMPKIHGELKPFYLSSRLVTRFFLNSFIQTKQPPQPQKISARKCATARNTVAPCHFCLHTAFA